LKILDSTFAPSIARQNRALLECMLKDPKHSWLKYADDPKTLHACARLYLGELSVTSKSRQRV